MAWPTLGPEVVDEFRAHGERRVAREDTLLFDVGQVGYDLHYVESGAVEVVDRADDRVVVRIEEGQFVGELGMLMGQRTFFAGVAKAGTSFIVVRLDVVRDLIARSPEVGDAVVSAFAARRRLLLEWSEGGLVLVGDDHDPASMRLREFAGRSHIPYRWVSRADAEAIDALARTCDLPPSGVAAVTGRSRVVSNASPRDLAIAMGLDLAATGAETFDLLVVGAGPAGLATCVYAASEGLSVLAIEDTAIGGQAGTSSRIENYLGFPSGISGDELTFRAQVQAIKFGARFAAPRRAVKLDRKDGSFAVHLEDGVCVNGRAVVLANGVRYRRLPVAGIERFEGRGVFYAATDLEARFGRDREVVIVGGGNSAGQAAMFLSRYATRTHVVVRGAGLSASMSAYLSTRILEEARVEVWVNSEVTGVAGAESLERVSILNRRTGERTSVDVGALFVMVGAEANTRWLEGQIALDDRGFVETGAAAGGGGGSFGTSEPGVFAVGDVRADSVKRVASAVGEGSVVVSSVHRYLTSPGR